MKKIYNYLIVLLIPGLFLLLTSETMFPGGSPGGRTGSPGDNGANCTGCHAGTVMNQEGWIVSDMIATGYTPGEEYDVFVAGIDPDALKWGFEATAEDASGTKVGTFAAGTGGFNMPIVNNTAITHTLLGNNPIADTGTVWFFKWTAPSESVGDITFYAAINAANGNGNTSGDQIHLSQFTASPAVGIPDNKLTISGFYPNPASDYVIIETDLNNSPSQQLEIINLHGQIVKRVELTSAKQNIDISGFDSGVYFMRSGNQTERLIIR